MNIYKLLSKTRVIRDQVMEDRARIVSDWGECMRETINPPADCEPGTGLHDKVIAATATLEKSLLALLRKSDRA